MLSKSPIGVCFAFLLGAVSIPSVASSIQDGQMLKLENGTQQELSLPVFSIEQGKKTMIVWSGGLVDVSLAALKASLGEATSLTGDNQLAHIVASASEKGFGYWSRKFAKSKQSLNLLNNEGDIVVSQLLGYRSGWSLPQALKDNSWEPVQSALKSGKNNMSRAQRVSLFEVLALNGQMSMEFLAALDQDFQSWSDSELIGMRNTMQLLQQSAVADSLLKILKSRLLRDGSNVSLGTPIDSIKLLHSLAKWKSKVIDPEETVKIAQSIALSQNKGVWGDGVTNAWARLAFEESREMLKRKSTAGKLEIVIRDGQLKDRYGTYDSEEKLPVLEKKVLKVDSNKMKRIKLKWNAKKPATLGLSFNGSQSVWLQYLIPSQ